MTAPAMISKGPHLHVSQQLHGLIGTASFRARVNGAVQRVQVGVQGACRHRR